MAVLNRKEDKVQAVLDRLPKQYTHEQFVEMFIKLFSKDWGKIKSAYIKQSQDKEPGTVINMPNPKSYLQQILTAYLNKVKVENVKPVVPVEEEVTIVEEEAPIKEDVAPVKPIKKTVKAIESTKEKAEASSKSVKATTPKKTTKEKITELTTEDSVEIVKKTKATSKKKEL